MQLTGFLFLLLDRISSSKTEKPSSERMTAFFMFLFNYYSFTNFTVAKGFPSNVSSVLK